jgi:hypothetical protein
MTVKKLLLHTLMKDEINRLREANKKQVKKGLDLGGKLLMKAV